MRDNAIQFAVVREDPEIESDLVAGRDCKRVLLIGSGGCTALSLKSRFPRLEITVIDPNPAQLGLIRMKMAALAEASSEGRNRLFNIDCDDPAGLNACGNFESLFRQLQGFIHEFVCEKASLERMFEEPDAFASGASRLVSHRYWPVGFRLFFSDPLLLAMFGPAAIQHAEPGSYPGYFQRAFERGLKAPGALDNYFLQHLLLGKYKSRGASLSLPPYLTRPGTNCRLDLRQVAADEVDDYGGYDLVSLSNIMDWMNEDAIAALAAKMSEEMSPGALLVFRQLNHAKTFDHLFGARFEFDPARAARLLAGDRSLFYSRLNIGRKL